MHYHRTNPTAYPTTSNPTHSPITNRTHTIKTDVDASIIMNISINNGTAKVNDVVDIVNNSTKQYLEELAVNTDRLLDYDVIDNVIL